MEYRAKKIYQDEDIVSRYDIERFNSLKGRLVHHRELSLIGKAIDYSGITPPAKVIDIPCGTGRLTIELARRGFDVRSVDLSPQMVSYAKEKIKNLKFRDKIRIEIGNAESLSFSDNEFDLGFSLRLLGHTPPENRMKILKELKRVVKSFVILVYYHRNCLQAFLRKKKRNKNNMEWYPVTYKEINDELKAAGLELLRYFPLLNGFSETVIVLTKKIVD